MLCNFPITIIIPRPFVLRLSAHLLLVQARREPFRSGGMLEVVGHFTGCGSFINRVRGTLQGRRRAVTSRSSRLKRF